MPRQQTAREFTAVMQGARDLPLVVKVVIRHTDARFSSGFREEVTYRTVRGVLDGVRRLKPGGRECWVIATDHLDKTDLPDSGS